VYHYGANNPLKYVDPDGRQITVNFAMDNTDYEPPVAIIDGKSFAIGFGLDIEPGDTVPDSTLFVVPEGMGLEFERRGERFEITGAGFYGPTYDAALAEIAASDEYVRAKRQNRWTGTGQIALGLGAWGVAAGAAASYADFESSTPLPISTVAGMAAANKIGGLLSTGAVSIAFGLGRLTGRHDRAILTTSCSHQCPISWTSCQQ
jgi:hypothetical protein